MVADVPAFMSKPPLIVTLVNVEVPDEAVTLPVTSPVTLPVTLPVTTPIMLPVTLPVTLPTTLPVRPPTKPVVAVTVLPRTVDGVVAPMGVELIEPPVTTALLEANVPLAVRVPDTVAVVVVMVEGLVPSSTIAADAFSVNIRLSVTLTASSPLTKSLVFGTAEAVELFLVTMTVMSMSC